jgi:acyl-CoA reductase-like NAD-dependent aldehyde dehydrogenase
MAVTLSGLREIRNPGNGELVAGVMDATQEQAGEAVRAAHAAFPAWARLGYAERGRILHACAEAF